MAALVSPKVISENAWMKITSSNQKQKANTLQKIELEKRKVIFWKVTIFPQKSETDLILVLNEAL